MTQPKRPDEVELWRLLEEEDLRPRYGAERIGMDPNRLRYLCEKWAGKGIYDYGVACDLGWKLDECGAPIRSNAGDSRSSG